MKKTILFLLNRDSSFLPPFMTILDSLCDEFSLKVISYETEGERKRMGELYKGRDVTFLHTTPRNEKESRWSRACSRVKNVMHMKSRFHREALQLISKTQHDLLWVIHENTAYEFRKELLGYKYILSFYELNDHRLSFLEQLTPVAKDALEVVVPEYNRACILRVWMTLDVTPTVIPNKPLNHPRERFIPNSFSEQLKGKTVILYQGYINRSRNLDQVCEAVKNIPGYCIVLMGKGDDSYISDLKRKYPHIMHISFIAPPEHLYVTSWAHIAIVKYDFVVLNAIFCAPNKTWEYTGFGIPVLCNAIPGLQYTIGSFKAGVCTDLDDVDCICAAIKEIDDNYEDYSRNAVAYYESFDVRDALLAIVNKHMGKNNAS